jgi:sucrose phosphorylase
VTLDRRRALPLLTSLYDAGADEALARLEALIERRRPRLASRSAAGPWDQSDVFLIGYPDQVRSPGSTPLQAFEAFARSRLQGLFGGLHLLPFFPSSSDDGFAVTDYRRVEPAFGSWSDVESLGRGYRLMVDLVLNHTSAGCAWFIDFCQGRPPYDGFFRVPEAEGDWSQVVRPRVTPLFATFDTAVGPREVWTTFGPDQVDLDYRNPGVLLEMVDLILEYVEHGAEVIRLDAVAFVGKRSGTTCLHLPEAHTVVKLLRLAARSAAPWVRLITETNVPHLDGLSYFGDGDEADLIYAFALPPLVAHTLTTGDSRPLTEWTALLSPPPGEGTFFQFLASHDGIGLNGASGLLSEAQVATLVERALTCGAVSVRSTPSGGDLPYELNVNLLDLLAGTAPSAPLPDTAVARFLCAHAILLSLPGVPAVYFHSLIGSRGDADGVRRTGRPRSINREKLELSDLERTLSEEGSARRRVFEGMARLLGLRRAQPAFHPRAAHVVLPDHPGGIFALERMSLDGGQRLICLHEVAGAGGRAAFAHGGQGRDLLTGDIVGLDHVALGPYQVRWLEVP